MSEGVLTYEAFKKFTQQAFKRVPVREPVYYCHPLEFPFHDALWGERRVQQVDTVTRWLFECRRKYRMGDKTGDQRWTLRGLIEQYTAKIEALRA